MRFCDTCGRPIQGPAWLDGTTARHPSCALAATTTPAITVRPGERHAVTEPVPCDCPAPCGWVHRRVVALVQAA